jgi:hypothetical protein
VRTLFRLGSGQRCGSSFQFCEPSSQASFAKAQTNSLLLPKPPKPLGEQPLVYTLFFKRRYRPRTAVWSRTSLFFFSFFFSLIYFCRPHPDLTRSVVPVNQPPPLRQSAVPQLRPPPPPEPVPPAREDHNDGPVLNAVNDDPMAIDDEEDAEGAIELMNQSQLRRELTRMALLQDAAVSLARSPRASSLSKPEMLRTSASSAVSRPTLFLAKSLSVTQVVI